MYQCKEETNQALFVGRIEFLDNKGKTRFSADFAEEEQFVREIKDCLSCGIPIVIVLYKDKNGKTISKKFVDDIDCMPAGFKEIDYPY